MTNLRPLVSVIIPAYGKSEQLPEVARSVARSSYRPLEVILVDNGVDRRALEASVRELEGVDVRVVGTGENLGTAAGRNAGARQARGELLLFLDSDVTLDEEAIEAMVDFLGSHPGYGIVGPLILYAGGGVYWSGGTVELPSGRVRMEADVPAEPARETDVVPSCMLVRKEAFEAVGGFFEPYFSGYEDSEFCIRAKRRGFRVACVCSARAHHHIPAGGREAELRLIGRVRLVMRNRLVFVRRNCPSRGCLLAFLLFYQWAYLSYYGYLIIKVRRPGLLKDMLAGSCEGLRYFASTLGA
jgi:hypothetical protein